MSKTNVFGRRRLMGFLLGTIFAANFFAAAPMAVGQEKKDDPDFLSVAVGAFDFNRQKDEGIEGRLEYRSDKKILFFKPFGAVAYSSSDHGFVGAGLLVDLFFGRRIVVTPSFAPNIYFGGNSKLDLDYWLEFRSQVEIAYRFDNRARLGLAVSHYSNGSFGDTNPGTESAMVYYSLPLNKAFGR